MRAAGAGFRRELVILHAENRTLINCGKVLTRSLIRLHGARIRRCARVALPKAWRMTAWLLKMMIPISLVVTLLQYFGILDVVARYVDPLFRFIGLPGSSAIAYVTGAALSTYAGLAALLSLQLTLRQATIVSLMILLCHALPMECAVTHKTGSSFWGMVVLRIAMAFVAAFYLNLVLPDMPEPFGFAAPSAAEASLAVVMEGWAVSQLRIAVLMFLIIYGIMLLQELLKAYHLLGPISRPLGPLMRLFGLPPDAAYFWLVGNTLGISYGGAVMRECLTSGEISRDKAAAVNRHLAMNHSLIEDTLVFASVGISIFWILSTRVLFALVVVWGRKLVLAVARRLRPDAA